MDPTNQTAAPPPVTTVTSGQFLSTSPSPVFLEAASPSPTVSREQLRINFYRTYDVMTGVRIAATLGGFFSLMVLLIVYKSKCKSKSISEEDLNAAVAAAEKESAQLSSVLDPAAFYSLNLDAERGPRRSLGNMSAPVFVRATRFSIGGYSNLDSSPCFQHQRGKSLPGSALHFPFNPRHNTGDGDRGGMSSSPSAGSCFQEVDAEQEEDSVLASPCCYHKFLAVPTDSRRLSSITCSSSDTSYLERRGSAVELGLPAPPFFPHRELRKGSEIDCAMPEESWDFYYPIDIQVIQPTPEMSPCGSERTLYDHPMDLQRASSVSIAESASCLSVPKLAPLASIGSCAISLSDYPDLDTHSVGSDSVFMDDDQDLDTEDEVEGFSTDSEDETIARNEIRRHPRQTLGRSPTSDVPFSQHFLQVPMSRSLQPAGRWGAAAGYQPRRRVSAPSAHYGGKKSTCDTISAKVAAEDSKGTTSPPDLDLPSCSSRSGVTQRPPFPLPAEEETNSTDSLTASRAVFEGGDTGAGSVSCDRLDQLSDPPRSQSLLALPSFPLFIRGSCEHLARALENRTPVNENCTWSQETLF